MRKKFFLILILIFILSSLFLFKQEKQEKLPQKNKLTFWTIQLKPIWEERLLKIIQDFEKKHPDIKIIWVDIPIQEAQKRTLASVLSSNPPDLINLNPEFSSLLAQRNVLETFDKNNLSQFNQNLIEKLKHQDKIYGLPFYATSPVTIYNKALYSKCMPNQAFPKTYDKLFEISKNLYTCSKVTPTTINLNENDTLAKLLNKYGINDLNNSKQKEKTIEILSRIDNLYKAGCLPKDSLTINHREMIEKYMSNQTVSINAGSNFINMIKQNAFETYQKSAITTQLTGSNGKYDVALMNLIIPKKSKNKKLALEFALILTNKENQLDLAKKTNVLPANKNALNDDYFKTCSDDLMEKSRCESAKQLNNLNNISFGEKNKKAINENINKTAEEILLNSNDTKAIKNKIDSLANELEKLIKD